MCGILISLRMSRHELAAAYHFWALLQFEHTTVSRLEGGYKAREAHETGSNSALSV